MDSIVFDVPVEALRGLLLSKSDDIKRQCLEYIMLLTGEPSRCESLYENSQTLSELINITRHDVALSKFALDSLVNVASSEKGAVAIFEADMENEWKSNSTIILLNHAVNKTFPLADHSSAILTNMTTWETLALKITKVFTSEDNLLSLAFDAIHKKNYNPSCPHLSDHMCQLFGNLAQSLDFQKYLISAQDGHLFSSILPLVNCGESILQKRGIVSLIYNCLFNQENHLVLLNSPFSILSYLLYPLAGPEEFDDNEVDRMPIELQYLGSEKDREKDPDVRKLLLKSLLMLCDTKNGRIFLRDHQTYPILREYHKWEKDASLILACENVVDILIRTEEEIGLDDLSSLEVPDDLKEKFDKMDADFIQEPTST